MINSFAFGLPRLMTTFVPASASGSSVIFLNAAINSSRDVKAFEFDFAFTLESEFESEFVAGLNMSS
jgi:hypothetical protein